MQLVTSVRAVFGVMPSHALSFEALATLFPSSIYPHVHFSPATFVRAVLGVMLVHAQSFEALTLLSFPCFDPLGIRWGYPYHESS
jgi:hypothetical protein